MRTYDNVFDMLKDRGLVAQCTDEEAVRKLLGSEKAVVNSFHHQAVKEPAPGFKVTAKSKDGIVEAIEMVGTDKVWGTQFHPESFVNAGDDFFLPLFEHLVKKAKEYRAGK